MELKALEFMKPDELTLGGIIASLVTNVIGVVISKVFFYFLPLVDRRGALARQVFYLKNSFIPRTLAIFALSLLGAIIATRIAVSVFGIPVDFYFVLSFVFALGMAMIQWQFARVGLHAAQQSVASGTGYEESLRLCKDRLSFLGTGAFKLTNAINFEDTIHRIDNQSVPVRLLLSHPSNHQIEAAARKAEVDYDQYSRNVEKSLRRLAKLKMDRKLNIDVRFYSDLQSFRMMFIDDNILLLSYNDYGKGDGSQIPQLVLLKSPLQSSSRLFYFAYEQYYETLWRESLAWNPEDYEQ